MSPINRRRKIALKDALRHTANDFAGTCESCKRYKVIKRDQVIARNLPPSMRLDEVEALFKCSGCGEKAITFQIVNANVLFTRSQR